MLLAGALPADRRPSAHAAIAETLASVGTAIAGLPPAAQEELGAALRAARLRARAHRARARRRRRGRDASAGRGRARSSSAGATARLRRCCARPTTRCTSSSSPRGTATRDSWPAIGYPGRPGSRDERDGTIRHPRPGRAGVAAGWKVIDASRARARPRRSKPTSSIVGTGAGGGTAAEILAARRSRGGPGRGRPAQDVARLPHARVRGLSRSSTRNRPRARRSDKAINILQGRCVGGGTTVNWTSSFRTPRSHARVLGSANSGSPASASPTWRRGSSGWRRGCRSRRGRSPPNANNDALARGAAKLGIAAAAIRAQRQGLLEPGLLRHGLPDQRQAVDAGDDDPGGAATAARRWSRARARIAFVLERRPRRRRSTRAAMDAARRAPDAAPRHRARARLRRRGRRDRHAGAAAAQPACPTRTASSASARSCIRRVVSAALMPERDRRRSPARRRPSTRITSSTRSRSTARSATSSRRRRCIRCSRRSRCPTTARRTRAGCASCRTCRCCSRCCATASIPTAPAAPCALRDDGTPVLDYPLHAVRVGRRAARVPDDGRDPVRRRRHGA